MSRCFHFAHVLLEVCHVRVLTAVLGLLAAGGAAAGHDKKVELNVGDKVPAFEARTDAEAPPGVQAGPVLRSTIEVRELAAQAAYLREIFGNPFRPVTFDPAWRTPTVTALASQMYGSRVFGAMPVLSDALQDAGCDGDDILTHCRSEGPHVRGCWVVDLVLGQGVACSTNHDRLTELKVTP